MKKYDPNFILEKVFFRVGQKAVLTNRQNEILVLRRSKKVSGAGKWSLPGGGLEKNESPATSIKREIKEETGLVVDDISPFTTRTYRSGGDLILVIGYQGKVRRQEIKLNWEHDDYIWMGKNEALKFDLSNDGKYFIQKYY